MAGRISRTIAVGALSLAATTAFGTPVAAADVVLPPIPSTGGGPIIGGGDEAAQTRISMQLNNIGPTEVQEGDGADAATFIMESAGLPRFSSTFTPLQRALGCQRDTSFGARAYRRADGQWGGALLVIAKSATPDLNALTACVKPAWPATTSGGPASMCANGWTYPTSGENHRPETYYILLAGTSADFCGSFNSSYANYASAWP